jgi:hypothetical protein
VGIASADAIATTTAFLKMDRDVVIDDDIAT